MDREKVIEGLRRCTEKAVPDCFRCPYSCHCEEGDTWVIKDDALALLKEQDERIKELELEKGWDESPDMMGKW